MTEQQIKKITNKILNMAMVYVFLIMGCFLIMLQVLEWSLHPFLVFFSGVTLTLMVTVHLIQIAIKEVSKIQHDG